MFYWCGSGTLVKINYTKLAVEKVKLFETAKDFIRALCDIDETLGFLKVVNKDFKEKVLSKRLIDKENNMGLNLVSESEFNLCCICLVKKMEMALVCGH